MVGSHPLGQVGQMKYESTLPGRYRRGAGSRPLWGMTGHGANLGKTGRWFFRQVFKTLSENDLQGSSDSISYRRRSCVPGKTMRVAFSSWSNGASAPSWALVA